MLESSVLFEIAPKAFVVCRSDENDEQSIAGLTFYSVRLKRILNGAVAFQLLFCYLYPESKVLVEIFSILSLLHSRNLLVLILELYFQNYTVSYYPRLCLRRICLPRILGSNIFFPQLYLVLILVL